MLGTNINGSNYEYFEIYEKETENNVQKMNHE